MVHRQVGDRRGFRHGASRTCDCNRNFKKHQLGTRHGAQPTARPSDDDADLTLGGTLLPMCSRCGCDEDGEPDALGDVEPNESGDESESDNEHSC